MNVIKTMLKVTVCFSLCWLPAQFFGVLTTGSGIAVSYGIEIFYGLGILLYVNVCLNPLIYASQYHVVRDTFGSLADRFKKTGKTSATTGSNDTAGTNH